MRRLILVNVVPLLIAATLAPAETRSVPGDHGTIQQAISVCSDGDAVVVGPGTYFETVNFLGKNIVVTSADPGDPEIVAATIIDGNGEGSVVTLENGETSEAVLTGFTISGGYGTGDTTTPGAEYVFSGAGIYCRNSSPTIKGNVIMNNIGPLRAEDDVPVAYGYGGGIACIESNALVTGNILKNNGAYAGGGIMTYMGDAEISNNLIHDNSAAVGGGVLLLESGRLLNNTIASNDASREIPDIGFGLAGNVHIESGAESSRFQIVNNIICDAKSGGGLFTISAAEIMIAFNDVWNNTGGNYGSMGRWCMNPFLP
jgi:hypothetical protein